MNGAGNDFIILNNLVEKLPESAFPALARRLCERHLSIGADGLIVVDAAQDRGDYRMRFYNSDGSLGEMCGNGARCVCRYGYETGLAGEKQTVETTAGIVTGVRITERLYRVRLNDPTVVKLDCPVEAEGVAWPCSYVELGNPGIPHAVIPWAGLRSVDEGRLREIGRALRHHPAFPKGANVNFYELLGKDTLYERTYERGVEDFTYACGTGTGSVVKLNCPVEVDGTAWPCSYVELGNPGIPHAVIPYPGLRQADETQLRELGRRLRHHPAFSKGANVNFYELTGEDTLWERTFERGVEDFTYACGTGTGSTVTVLTLQGKVSGKAVRVQMTGGELIIDAKRRGSRVERLFLTGPTNIVCKGQVTDEDLAI